MSRLSSGQDKVTRCLAFGVAAGLAVVGFIGCAQRGGTVAYPTRAVELVVPASAGGTSDQTARIVAPWVQKKWGQPVNVVNKAGGSGAPASLEVVQSPPEAYMLLMISATNPILSDAMKTDLPYHWDSFTYLARFSVSPMAVVVKGDSPYNSLKELMAQIQKDPTKLKYGTASATGPGTLGASQVAEAAGVDPNKVGRVPFDGGAPTAAALAGGHVDFSVQMIPEIAELTRGGKLKALAVTTPDRVKELPNVPTSKELGYPSINQMGQFGVGGPAKIPEEIVKKWEETIGEAMKDAQFKADLEKTGSIPSYLTAKEYRPWVESEYKNARALAEKLGLRK